MEEYGEDHIASLGDKINEQNTDYDSDDAVDYPAYTLPPASPEQKHVVDALKTHNAIVDAVAGSGKTTTVLHIATELSEDRILLLTYNAGLKRDTAARAIRLGLHNIEVRTYHSFCVRYVNAECFTDTGISKHLPEYLAQLRDMRSACAYDVIIIDECQDMTALYYDVARAAIGGGTPRLLVVGDRCQSIYQYKGSDPRYLTFANNLYASPHKWSRLCLSISYRITRQMAALVNCVKNADTPRITAIKDGPKPFYLYCSAFELASVIQRVIAKNNPEDVFILAPSVRIMPNHRLAPLANNLTRMNVPIYIPNSDDKCPDDCVLRGKAAFITFHQAKGLERKIVFVLSFDETLFSVQKEVSAETPNTLYVALTRATTELYLWHSTRPNNRHTQLSPPMLPYLTPADVRDLCTVTHRCPSHPNELKRVRKPQPTCVTNLIRHIPEFYSDWMMSKVTLTTVREPRNRIDIPAVVIQREQFYEEVSDITGTASVAYYEQKTRERCTIREELPRITLDELPALLKTPKDILYCANLYNSKVSNLRFKVAQVTEYNWVTNRQFVMMSKRLAAVTPGENEFECPINCLGFDRQYSYTCVPRNAVMPAEPPDMGVSGRIDILSANGIFEVKTVGVLTSEHYLQLLMYYYGMKCGIAAAKVAKDADDADDIVIPQPYLYNVLTDELVHLSVDDATLCMIMRAINHVRNHSDELISDAEFIARSKLDRTPQELIAMCPKCKGTFLSL